MVATFQKFQFTPGRITEMLPRSQGGISKMNSHEYIYSWLIDGKWHRYLQKRNQNLPPKILAEKIPKGGQVQLIFIFIKETIAQSVK